MDQDAIAIMVWQATILGINVFLAMVGTSILAEPEATGSGHCLPSGLFRGNRQNRSPKTRRVFTSGDQGLHRTAITSKPAQLARLARGHERRNPRTFASNRLFLVHCRSFTGTGPTVLRFACHNVRGIGVKFREFLPPVSPTFQLRQA